MCVRVCLYQLDRHGHLDHWVRLVLAQLEVAHCKLVDRVNRSFDSHLWPGSRFTLQLLVDLLDMIGIDVSVAKRVDELAWLELRDVSDHDSQKSIGRNVEGDAQAHVSRALIQLATELAISDVKLAQAVARRQRHLVKIGWIPGHHQHATVVGIGFDCFN